MNCIAFIRYNFTYISQNIIFFKHANIYHQLLKELSTFLFDKCITLKKKWIYFNLNIFCQYSMFWWPLKVKNYPQAFGRIPVDLRLFGQTGRFFLYPRVPPCRANFLSIRPRIKFLFTKLLEIENYGKKPLRINLASRAQFPTFLTIFKRL